MIYLYAYLATIIPALAIILHRNRDSNQILGISVADASIYLLVAMFWPVVLLIMIDQFDWYIHLQKRLSAFAEAFWSFKIIKPKQ